MAFPTNFALDSLPPPGYFIYRDAPLGQQYDPTAPPVFFPAKDSDELFDALRTKFPHVKSHSERMRDAIIEFLMEERQAEALAVSTQPSPDMALDSLDSLDTSPWQQSWPSMSSGSGSASPETFDLSFDKSRTVHRQASNTTSNSGATQPSTPQIEDMTGVFCLSTSAQPKQRLRRKMTEAEKIEYRKRRIVKACDKCAKRKRKCQHNQPEMESIATKATNKISKTRTSPSNKSISTTTPKTDELNTPVGMDSFVYDGSFANDMQLFDDFTTVFDEPLLDFNAYDDEMPFNNFVNNQQFANKRPHDPHASSMNPSQSEWSQWPWSDGTDGQDFALTDFGSGSSITADSSDSRSSSPGSQSQSQSQSIRTFESMTDRTGIGRSHATEYYDPGFDASPGLSLRNVTTRSSDQQQQQRNVEHVPAAHQDTATALPVPTHTAHVHLASGEAYVFDSPGSVAAREASEPPGTGLYGSELPQTGPRVVGTAKAVKSLGRSLTSKSSTSSVQSDGIGRVLGTMTQDSASQSGVAHTRPRVPQTHNQDSGSRRQSALSSNGISDRKRIGVAARIDGVPGLSGKHSVPPSSASSDAQTSTSVSGSSISLQGDYAAHQGRPPAQSGGESVLNTVSSSVELYRLKKQIATSLGKPQDRSTKGMSPDWGSTGLQPVLPASSSVASLLQTIPPSQVKRESNSSVSTSLSKSRLNVNAHERLDTDNYTRPTEAVHHTNALEAQTNRLRDYFKVKDHRGRSTVFEEDKMSSHNQHSGHHGRNVSSQSAVLVSQGSLPKTWAASTTNAVLCMIVAACFFTSFFRRVDLPLLALALIAPIANDRATSKSSSALIRAASSSTNGINVADMLRVLTAF
ncbi:Hypothetical protein R9X50_00425300 [Acrodontium crateriforme]|uniref:Uncharacterized protein n=1 Tax=Acrodontium crateriforme TaxID=150365 RepID=A0AAQ3RCK0_9PEZI|nr:Hypothetical protein R9X50_00425300 [Acrodontium crateriforme]